MSEGNELAYAMLAIWPIFSIRLYQTKTIQVATLWTILGGFMFLPVRTEVDLPLIPPLGKNSIPVISALLGCWFIKQQKILFFTGNGLFKFLVISIFLVPFITTELNNDAIILAGRFIDGLNHHDALSATLKQFLFIAPFFIGRRFFRTYENQILMFKVLVVAGLYYSLLMLFEIRMSPQLHSWIYGYYPHSFLQQMRQGGFRPMVFMGHGLLTSFFITMVLTSAIVLWKNKEKATRFSASKVSYYLLVVLLLCKSIASLSYGLFTFFLIKRAAPKRQIHFAIILVLLALLYPSLSILKIFPHQKISEVAASINADRAQSLDFRFKNEEVLLEHARERFFFGWGGWGRNRVYDERGKNKTVTDGRWVITFGQFGWIGFLLEFGLLGMTVFKANIASRLIKNKKELNLISAHALLVGVILIDQLPNASLAPWLWFLAGILLGRVEAIIAHTKNKVTL